MVRLWVFSTCLLLACASPPAAISYSAVYAFGDSLVDSGNTQKVAEGFAVPRDPAPVALGYFDGRFSNGPVYSDLLHDHFVGGNMVESTLGGTNYAFGGARGQDNSPRDPIPDLGAQVALYLEDVGGVADPTALYLINAGGNDVRDILLGVPGSDVSGAVAQIVGAVSALSAAGANHFLVVGVGNVGGIPETIARGPAAESAGRSMSEGFNAALFRALMAPGLPSVHTLDPIPIGDAVQDSPAAYGLPADLDFRDACLDAMVAPPEGPPICTGYAFFDTIHPTDAVNAILADAAIAAVAGPRGSGRVRSGWGHVAGARRCRSQPESLHAR